MLCLLCNILSEKEYSKYEFQSELDNLCCKLWHETLLLIERFSHAFETPAIAMSQKIKTLKQNAIFTSSEIESIPEITNFLSRTKLIKDIQVLPISELPNEFSKIVIGKCISLEHLNTFMIGNISEDRNGNKDIIKQITKSATGGDIAIFSSTALITGSKLYHDTLFAYGEILVVFKKEAIEPEAYIFNGDVQNISSYVKHNNLAQYVFYRKLSADDVEQFVIDIRKKTEEANSNHATNCLERIRGEYMECRIFKPLFIEDIELIYAPPKHIDEISKFFEKPLIC